MPRHRIALTPTARKQLRLAVAWWREHRPENPGLLEDEVAEAGAALTDAPLSGALHMQAGIQGVRRMLLPRTQYFLYYRVDAAKHVVRVIAVWRAMRGTGPPLS
jgi:plasmid stabilization system protein ParE